MTDIFCFISTNKQDPVRIFLFRILPEYRFKETGQNQQWLKAVKRKIWDEWLWLTLSAQSYKNIVKFVMPWYSDFEYESVKLDQTKRLEDNLFYIFPFYSIFSESLYSVVSKELWLPLLSSRNVNYSRVRIHNPTTQTLNDNRINVKR